MKWPRPIAQRYSAAGTGGFSMVELLVTMLILTVVLVGLAALQISVVRGVTGSRRSDEATRLGQTVLERYLSVPWDRLTPGGWFTEPQRDANAALYGTGTLNATMANVAVDGTSPGPFRVETRIESHQAGQVMLIAVRVTWVEGVTGGAGSSAAATGVTLATMRSAP